MKRDPIVKLEELRRGEYFSRSNIFHHEYSQNTVSFILKHYWPVLEAGRDTNPDLADSWIDLTSAMNSTDEPIRTVLYAYAEGYRSGELNTYTGQPRASRLLIQGFRMMVDYLKGKNE